MNSFGWIHSISSPSIFRSSNTFSADLIFVNELGHRGQDLKQLRHSDFYVEIPATIQGWHKKSPLRATSWNDYKSWIRRSWVSVGLNGDWRQLRRYLIASRKSFKKSITQAPKVERMHHRSQSFNLKSRTQTKMLFSAISLANDLIIEHCIIRFGSIDLILGDSESSQSKQWVNKNRM